MVGLVKIFRILLVRGDVVAERLGTDDELAADRLRLVDDRLGRLRKLRERCRRKQRGKGFDRDLISPDCGASRSSRRSSAMPSRQHGDWIGASIISWQAWARRR